MATLPTVITDLTATPGPNYPQGSDTVFPSLDNLLREYGAYIKQNYDDLATKTEISDLADTGTATHGDFLVGRKRTFTSAVASTWHAWAELQPIDLVADCGVVADGSTNNTTAINVALSAASALGGALLILPVGTVNYATTLAWPANTHLIGQGDTSVLRYTGSSNAISSVDVFPTDASISFRNFKLTTTTSSPSTGPGVDGIVLNNAVRVLIDCQIRGFGNAGVNLASTTAKANIDVTFGPGANIHENVYGVMATGANVGANSIKFLGPRIRANSTYNIYSTLDIRAWTFLGGTYEAGGIYLNQPIGLAIIGAYFEMGGASICVELANAQDATGVTIEGCHFAQTSLGTGTGIKLGTSAFVRGVNISGNTFIGWGTGIDPGAVIGGCIGPNAYSSVTTQIGIPGSLCTGLMLNETANSALYGGGLAQYAHDGSSWVAPSPYRYTTVPIGSVAYGSMGNDTTTAAGTIYFCEVHFTAPMTLTGAGILTGSVANNNNWIFALYDFKGTLLANSALAGAKAPATNDLQQLAFTATYSAQPGKYWIAIQNAGATDRFRAVAASTFADVRTKSQAGAFGTIPSTFTIPTTFTANVGPIAYVY